MVDWIKYRTKLLDFLAFTFAFFWILVGLITIGYVIASMAVIGLAALAALI